MQDIYETDICELLSEAILFSNEIDKYAGLLGLNKGKVTSFKNDVRLLSHLVENDDAFTQDFISYQAIVTQGSLTALVVDCTLNKNFNQQIGDALGIKISIYNTAGLKTDFKVKWSAPVKDVRQLSGMNLVINTNK
jgi:hypothetical protein